MRAERIFLLALLAGPLVWLALFLMGRPVLWPQLPLQNPGLFLLLVLVYPVLEECVFRGVIQGGLGEVRGGYLRQSFGGISLANLLTSVLFAAMHLISQPPLWAACVFFPSLIYGYFRDRDDHIMRSIILHVFYNVGFFALFVSA